MRSRKRLLLSTTVLVTALTAGIADAAPPPGAQKPQSSSSQFALRREEAGGGDATVARQRARAGDCAGALPAFDAAVRVTIEPTLRRDRGLCHEKLGDPFPAIEDYRAYLVARPDAPDADQIRDRLARLEESVGVGARSAASFRESDESLHGGGSFALATEGGGKASASTSSRARANRENEALGPRPGEQERSYDYYATQERLADAADSSPLRYGTGWIVAPFLMMPRYFVGGTAPKDLAFGVGASFRYAWSPSMTFLAEVGYAGLGQAGQQTSSGGPLVFAGIEGRVPLDKWSSNQLVLGIGPGYEHYTFSGTRQATHYIEGRARFGYRHIFGPSVGLEFLVDGGPAYRTGDVTKGEMIGVVGGMFALSIGF